MPDALVAHHHVECVLAARHQHRLTLVQRVVRFFLVVQREHIDAEFFVLQKFLDPRNGLLVAADVGQGRVDRQKAVRLDVPIPRRHVASDRFLQRHVTILTDPFGIGQVEGSSGVERHAAVVPTVVFVLAAQPAVAVDARVEADLVAGGAKLRGAEEGLEHLLLVDDGPRLQRGVVYEAARAFFGLGEQIGILLLVGDVVVAVAGLIVNLVDGVAAQAGQTGLGLGRGAVDLFGHFTRQHQCRIVATRAPLGLDFGLFARQPLVIGDMRVNLRIALGRVAAHVVDRRLVEGIVERGKAVRRCRPLFDDGRVTTSARLRTNRLVDHKAVLVHVASEFFWLREIAARDDPRGQHIAGRSRSSRREKGAFSRDEIGGDEVVWRKVSNFPRLGTRPGVLASGKCLLGRLRVLLAAIGQPV